MNYEFQTDTQAMKGCFCFLLKMFVPPLPYLFLGKCLLKKCQRRSVVVHLLKHLYGGRFIAWNQMNEANGMKRRKYSQIKGSIVYV